MKALSVQPYYATLIATGEKFIELRTWKTSYRGWILICSSSPKTKFERQSMVSGKAVAVANLCDVRPFVDETDRELSCLDDDESFSGYSWVFDCIIPIEPFVVKGQQRLFNVDYELEELIPCPLDYESESFIEDLYKWWLENNLIENLEMIEYEE